MRALNLTATAVLAGSLLSACGGDSASENVKADIAVTTCTADPAGGKPRATGTIKNNTGKPSGYTFRVRFLDPAGNEVSQATNAVSRVEAAGTATWTMEGNASAKGALRCEVDNATRTAVGT